MMRLLKSFCGTIGVCLGIIVLVILMKLMAMIPVEAMISLLTGNWPGLLVGVVISYVGMGVSELIGGRKKRHKKDEDEYED